MSASKTKLKSPGAFQSKPNEILNYNPRHHHADRICAISRTSMASSAPPIPLINWLQTSHNSDSLDDDESPISIGSCDTIARLALFIRSATSHGFNLGIPRNSRFKYSNSIHVLINSLLARESITGVLSAGCFDDIVPRISIRIFF